mmetsp:Transcript_32814/g.53373  ORF Transcript_32814/g.53373 Transcript_32814/m.53373 type:complete len:81 (-) Transcript_32814:11-253(-)
MVRSNIRPNMRTFCTILDGCVAAGDTALMEEYFNNMADEGVRPDQVAYNIMLKGYARSGNVTQLHHWRNLMAASNIKPGI